jgi:hypothetical protein
METPEGYTESGQAWIYNIHGEKTFGYSTFDLAPFIYIGEPLALKHEILHYLDWKLHPNEKTENGTFRYTIIGHNVEGDPFKNE